MKFPIIVRKRLGELMPIITVGILGCPLRLTALIDTGSPYTVITPSGRAMLKIRNPPKRQPKDYYKIKLGGHNFKRYLMDNLSICLKSEDKKIAVFDMPDVGLLIPYAKVKIKEINQEFGNTHMIIGCDFLKTFNLSFYFHPSSETGYFLSPD